VYNIYIYMCIYIYVYIYGKYIKQIRYSIHKAILTFGPPRSIRPAWLETDTESIETSSSSSEGGLNEEKSNECRGLALINRRGCMPRRSSCREPTIHARMFELVWKRKRKGEIFREKEAEGRVRESKEDSSPLNCSD